MKSAFYITIFPAKAAILDDTKASPGQSAPPNSSAQAPTTTPLDRYGPHGQQHQDWRIYDPADSMEFHGDIILIERDFHGDAIRDAPGFI